MAEVAQKQTRKWRYWPGLLIGIALTALLIVATGLANDWQEIRHAFRYGIEDELAWWFLAGKFLPLPALIAVVVFIRNRFVR